MRSRLNRAAGMLCKIRHYVNFDTLKMIYYGIFSSILMYGSLIWGQHNRIVKRLQTIQNKAIRYMTFKSRKTPAIPLFKVSGILNLKEGKYSTGLCQDLIEIDRDRIDGQSLLDIRIYGRFAPEHPAGHEYNCMHR